MAKYKLDIASNVSVPGKPQPIGPAKPSQLAITAMREDSSAIGASPVQITVPSIDPTQTVTPPISVNINQTQGVVLPFGAQNNSITSYPNDVVRFDLYNANNQWLGVNYRIDDYKFSETTQGQSVSLDVERNIQQLGYLAGRYNFAYKFHRNILGSGDPEGHKLSIQEISYNGLEIRVRPLFSSIIDCARRKASSFSRYAASLARLSS